MENANDNEASVDAVVDADVEEETPEAELDKDTTDWKAEALKARGQATRFRNKLQKATEKKVETPAPKDTKQDSKQDLDYGQKAYLRAEGIKAANEEALVKDWMKDTGKKLEDVLSNKRFQAELAEMREADTTQAAIPSSSNRSQAQSRSDVDYWLSKPFSEVPKEMRMKVIEARKQRDGGTSRPDF